jgi:signal transduction histidine kinase
MLSRLSEVEASLPQTIGEVCRLLPVVLFLHVFLAYPSGRLEHRFERVLLAVGYASTLGFGLAAMALSLPGHPGLIDVASRPDAAEVVLSAGRITIVALTLFVVGDLLVRARRSGSPLGRWLIVACFALALIAISLGLVARLFELSLAEPLQWVAFALIGLAPILFLAGFLRSRLARSAAADLFVELRNEPAPAHLRDVLARALRDPSLALVYWLPDFGVYVDLQGRPVELSDLEGRSTTLIDRDGEHVAALIHDPALDDEPELLDSVQAAAAIALENARLHAELRARLAELRGSRARIVEAAQQERQLLERNLHDGAQQRLIALSLDLGLLQGRVEANSEVQAGIDQARREIATSLAELREISRGLHPAVVSGHGLAIALEQLAARAPVPVDLNVEVDGRLPEPLEVAAYYVVAESLANVAKHAQAKTTRIDVVQEGNELVLEIVDDGIGGADSERGSGLRGLADRVEALNGRLRVWTPRGGGTRVRAEIPCA